MDAEQDKQEEELESSSMGFMSHLIELRDRLLRIVVAILLIFLSLFYWANDIYTYLAEPLTRHLPEGSNMIAIDVASPFLTPFKLVLMLSIFAGMPYILYQIWSFIAPGLYKHEKRLAGPLLASSIVLFYCGMLFAYYVVFPLVFGFFTTIGPEMVAISTDIGRYLDFVISLFFGFGIAFEVPIATIILVAMGITTPNKLSAARPYVIVAAFVLGMLLTPPDVISQVLLAIPVWFLFEAGVVASRYLFADRLKKQEQEDAFYQDDNDDENSIYGDDYEVVKDPADDEYQPMTDEEMDAELDRMDEEEKQQKADKKASKKKKSKKKKDKGKKSSDKQDSDKKEGDNKDKEESEIEKTGNSLLDDISSDPQDLEP